MTQQDDPLANLPWPTATVTPSETCSKAIRGACTAGLCSKRGVSSKGRAAATIGLSALLLAYYVWYARSDRPSSELMTTGLFGALGWLGAQSALVAFALARPPGKRGPRALRLALLLAIPVLFMGYLALISHGSGGLAAVSHGFGAAHAVGCGAVALLLGGIVAGGAMMAWRRTDPYNPGLSGALIGMVGGIASGAGMGVACPSHETMHALLAHGIVVFALAFAGFGLGRRLLAP